MHSITRKIMRARAMSEASQAADKVIRSSESYEARKRRIASEMMAVAHRETGDDTETTEDVSGWKGAGVLAASVHAHRNFSPAEKKRRKRRAKRKALSASLVGALRHKQQLGPIDGS